MEEMKIEIHQHNGFSIAEIISNEIVIRDTQDALDLLGNLYYQNFDKIIISEKNIGADFFDLSTGIAGEILQKFSNYRVRLVIIGDYYKYSSKSLHDFIAESNRHGEINFVATLSEAIAKISKH